MPRYIVVAGMSSVRQRPSTDAYRRSRHSGRWGNKAHTWLLAFAHESWPTITKPIWHPAYRFPKKARDAEVACDGLPTPEEFREFALERDPGAKPHELRLDAKRRGLLARWQVQFKEIRAELDRVSA